VVLEAGSPVIDLEHLANPPGDPSNNASASNKERTSNLLVDDRSRCALVGKQGPHATGNSFDK
jgi:hypothetical protein